MNNVVQRRIVLTSRFLDFSVVDQPSLPDVFAEHLGLREKDEVDHLIAAGNLKVIEIHAIKPRHRKAEDEGDPLFAARSKESTRLFRMKKS